MKEIFEQYYVQLLYFGGKLVENKQVVEDIVVDCMVKFYERKYAARLANGILYACVKNACLNYNRSQARRHKIDDRLFNEEYIGLQIMESRLMQVVNDAIQALPPDCRDVIIMYYIEEKNCIQIASLLHKTPATVRSLKRHGLNKLVNLKCFK